MTIFEIFKMEADGLKIRGLKYERVGDRFEAYIVGKENKTVLQARFLNSKHLSEEKLSEFT